MEFPDALTDVRLWIITAVIVGFLIGDMGSAVPNILVVGLILQITASMVGITIHLDYIKRDFKRVLLCIFFNFGVNSFFALLCGYLFPSNDIGLFYGWAMIAAVPSAVSCVTVALTMYGNRVLSVISLAAIYVVSLVLTPVISLIFIGDAVPPLQILKYIFLFVAIPLIATIPLNKLNIKKKPKAAFINFMMFLLVALSIGRNREYFFSSPDIIAWIVLFAVMRTFVLAGVLLYILRRSKVDRGDSIVYASLAIWKNTGLACSMCLILIPDMPQAAIPCAVCLLVESLWYAVNNNIINKYWPPEYTDKA